jgi:hypothetical protein
MTMLQIDTFIELIIQGTAGLALLWLFFVGRKFVSLLNNKNKKID